MAPGNVDADLIYGDADRHVKVHPAFAFFAGLPCAQGLNAAAHQTWLAVGGGQMLWDELAAPFGFKPLVAGHTGPSAGVWTNARLERASDLAGARLQVAGLAADVVRALGATPVALSPQGLKAELAAGRLQAAEWLGPLAAAAPDLQPLAERLYQPGFHPDGMVLSLAVTRNLWDGMSAADRAIFEACAAQEYHLSRADARAHVLMASQIAAPSKWPVRHAWSGELAKALNAAAGDVVAHVGATDSHARDIQDSYRAFRLMLGEPPSA
jgi:TRAP-type mannitol/chloroaromatic compound transport system substrate-binding protein